MYTDFPKITRCCFCIPLRYGLQVWGFVKLITVVASLVLLLAKTWMYLIESQFICPLAIVLMIMLVDIIFSIFLVIATHMKNQILFKIYFTYSVVLAVVMIIGFLIDLVITVISFLSFFHIMMLEIVIANAVTLVGMTLLQMYITLLVRTELRKLRDNASVQFFNHTSNPQVDVTMEKSVGAV